MAGSITFESNFTGNKVFGELVESVGTAVKRAAEFALADVVARTQSGSSSSGVMPGYSDGYKRVRAKKGLPTGHVDMTFSGKMMQSLATKTFREGTTVGFEIAPTPNEAAKVSYTTNYPQRNWFELSDREKEEAIRTIIEG